MCKEKTFSELEDVSKYKNIHLIVDDDSNILRMYAIKEVGTDMLAGVVKSIKNVNTKRKTFFIYSPHIFYFI